MFNKPIGANNKEDVDSVTTFIRSIIQILEFRIRGWD